jgi:very-short-patch-repair endonuclease
VQKIRAKQLRKNSTDAERQLWRVLRSRQLAGHKFRRQQPLGGFIVDFVCFEKRLVVEVDGGQHNEPLQAANDSERSTWLEQQGFRVLRFWNHEILREIESVKETIARALG